MSVVQTRTFLYSIDSTNAILCVDDPWLKFARENGAPELTREFVVGRCLWDFVAGRETRALYEAIFDRVRREEVELSLPFRCDSPDRFRFMRLTLFHRAEGTIEFESVLLREQERPYFPILDKLVSRSPSSIPICSLCRRVRILGSEWVEAEDAVARTNLFGSAPVPRLEEHVCSDCEALSRASSFGNLQR
jgi:hypothetical protein